MSPKKYLRFFLINLAALWFVASYLPGVSYSGGLKTLASAALALTIVNFIVKPLLKLLLLPINLITLGAFRWLINVLGLYLVTLVVSEFRITGFLLAGFTYRGFVIPDINLNTFWAFVVTSFIISFISSFLIWLRK